MNAETREIARSSGFSQNIDHEERYCNYSYIPTFLELLSNLSQLVNNKQ